VASYAESAGFNTSQIKCGFFLIPSPFLPAKQKLCEECQFQISCKTIRPVCQLASHHHCHHNHNHINNNLSPWVLSFTMVPMLRWSKTYRISRPIRHTAIFSLEILEKKWWIYFNFSNLLEENRIVTYQN